MVNSKRKTITHHIHRLPLESRPLSARRVYWREEERLHLRKLSSTSSVSAHGFKSKPTKCNDLREREGLMRWMGSNMNKKCTERWTVTLWFPIDNHTTWKEVKRGQILRFPISMSVYPSRNFNPLSKQKSYCIFTVCQNHHWVITLSKLVYRVVRGSKNPKRKIEVLQ